MPGKNSSTRKSSSRTSRGRSTTARGGSARGRATSRAQTGRSAESSRSKSSGRRTTSARRVGTTRRTSRARTTATSTGSTSNITTGHEFIRRWAEARGARPTCVRGTGGPGDIGVLRLDFPGYSGAETLEHISWDEWFEKFDERDLALLYQDTAAAGEPNNFNKLVSRHGVEGEAMRAGESMRLGESAARMSRRNALRPAVEILEIDVEEVPTGGRSRMMGEM